MVSIKGVALFAIHLAFSTPEVGSIQAAKLPTENVQGHDTQSKREISHMPIELTDSNFDHQTQLGTHDTTGPWFIKFYAPWCGHCRRMEQVWNEFADETFGQLNVGSVDATSNRKLAERFGITGYPTLLFFDKKMLYRYSGVRTREAFQEFALNGGFREVKAEAIPRPLSTFDLMRKRFVEFVYDFEAVITDKPSAAVAIAVSGLFLGMSLGGMITGVLMQRRYARNAKKLN